MRPERLSSLNYQALPTEVGDRYLVHGEIARGGMGTVLRAFDCDLRREVALKFLLNQTDAEEKTRFLKEAQITGQLEHPNIVPIHELSCDDRERPFFTMKMIRGRSLAQVLQDVAGGTKVAEREWALGRLLHVFVSVCNAAIYAHARGVIHRDLKSANIMIGDFGEVYVMDWGVAKVLRGVGTPRAAASLDTSGPASRTVPSAPQDAEVVGTPVYMSPEQASGQPADQRSDVYALGAILYEILCLQSPIPAEGGYLNVIMRVLDGAIAPPEQRDRRRARAGKIPRELSAIAMKALAREPGARYPNVLALRRDVERFQEGRSISARADAAWEAAWKLVKRNRGISLALFVSLLTLGLVLGASVWTISRARVRAERATTTLVKEQTAKRMQALNSVSAYLRAAQLAIAEHEFEGALAYVESALEILPEHDEARLLRGQLLIVERKFAAAAAELARHLQLRPGNAAALTLLRLCDRARDDDPAAALAFAEAFARQHASALADGMLQHLGTSAVTTRLLEVYRQRIERAWPGLGQRLAVDDGGALVLNFNQCRQVTDLAPLKGMPLSRLYLYQCDQVRDLTPLRGMPLTVLYLGDCRAVRDLGPLREMQLTCLNLYRCPVADLEPLRGMPLTVLDLSGCPVDDLSPLRGMPLAWLNLGGCVRLTDLAPLEGLPLMTLYLLNCPQVRDLTPLRGMRLGEISFHPGSIVHGLDALRAMTSLKTVSVSWARDGLPADTFWKRHAAGEFR